ncbi:hypothetical protein CKO13_11935, partial [Halorhodospira neutriphila]|nr:hypothetical protein [Halorhodospira neutriphila]
AFLGTVGVDAVRYLVGDEAAGYSLVFSVAAVTFLVSAWLAARVERPSEAVLDHQRTTTTTTAQSSLP